MRKSYFLIFVFYLIFIGNEAVLLIAQNISDASKNNTAVYPELQLDYSKLIGTWENVNPNTRSIKKIVISQRDYGLYIEPYFSFGGKAASLGGWYARVYGTSISDTTGVAFTIEVNFGFEEEITIGRLSGTYLNVIEFTMFTDNSLRSNFYLYEQFKKK